MSEPLYFEAGGSWSALAFPVGLAAVGIGLEALTGPVFWWFWIAAGVVLLPFTALWVYARRRFCVVRVTGDELTQGAETLPVDQITQVSDASSADHELLGDRVLGGGQAVPRKYQPVRLGLSDDTRVLAWARDGDALRTALRRAAGA